VVAVGADGRRHLRYDDLMPLAGMEGDLESMALYAGQSAGLVREVLPAGEIVRQIATEAAATLQRASATAAGLSERDGPADRPR
jgi:nitronate monooxygenase/enoyl-[acyl-carrier protein] reductase II